jgi:regulator of RNase E activity RraA
LTGPDRDTHERIERVLRWAMIEIGTAGLSDRLGPQVLVPEPPRVASPVSAAIAGPVVLMRRSRTERDPSGSSAAAGSSPAAGSSFAALAQAVRPGCVVLVRCEPDVGAAFGSNLALHAVCLRAQAIVTDSACRDRTRLENLGMGWAANGTDPTRPRGAAMVRVPSAALFGTEWNDGDWFLRDRDGAIRLTHDAAADAADALTESASGELADLLAW